MDLLIWYAGTDVLFLCIIVPQSLLTVNGQRSSLNGQVDSTPCGHRSPELTVSETAKECSRSRGHAISSTTEINRRHSRYYLKILAQANDLYVEGGEALERGLNLFDLEWPNIQVGHERASRRNADDDEAALLSNQYPGYGSLLLRIRQHPRDQIRWCETALAVAQRLKDRLAEAVHLGNLSSMNKSWTLLDRLATGRWKHQRSSVCLSLVALAVTAKRCYGLSRVSKKLKPSRVSMVATSAPHRLNARPGLASDRQLRGSAARRTSREV
jgi:hypothetical protein